MQLSSQGVPHCPLALLHWIVNRKHSGSHCGSLETKCVSFLSCVFWSWPVISAQLLVRVHAGELLCSFSLHITVHCSTSGSNSRNWMILYVIRTPIRTLKPSVEPSLVFRRDWIWISGFSFFFLDGNTHWTGVYASSLSHSYVIQWVIGIAFTTQVCATVFSNYTFVFYFFY